MKNSQGVEIRVGQVWECKHGYHLTIQNTDGQITFFHHKDERSYTRSADDRLHFHRLISCPKLGDMSGHDLVTDEQKRDYHVPSKDIEFFFEGSWLPVEDSALMWHDYEIWRVPRNFDWKPHSKPSHDDFKGVECSGAFSIRWDNLTVTDSASSPIHPTVCRTCNKVIGKACECDDGSNHRPQELEPLECERFDSPANRTLGLKINAIIDHINRKEQG